MSHTPLFPKKTVYHTALRDATADGPLAIRITSEPTKSKYAKNGQDQFFIDFQFEGRDQQYICENKTITDALRGLKGHMIEITATGSRNEAALDIFDAASPATNTPAPPPRQPRPQQQRDRQSSNGNGRSQEQAPAERNFDGVKDARHFLMQTANAYLMAMEAVLYVARMWDERHPDEKMTAEHFQAATASHFIALDRAGKVASMPKHPMKADRPRDDRRDDRREEEPPPRQDPPRAPNPPRQRDPDDGLAEDDIPF